MAELGAGHRFALCSAAVLSHGPPTAKASPMSVPSLMGHRPEDPRLRPGDRETEDAQGEVTFGTMVQDQRRTVSGGRSGGSF